MTDLVRLKGHLTSSGYKLQHVAQVMGVSTNALRLKLHGDTEFKLREAERLARLLELSPEERDLCFLAPKARGGAKGVPGSDCGTARQDQTGAPALRGKPPGRN